MLTMSEMAQVDQATEAYCALIGNKTEGVRRRVYHEMLMAFSARKRLNVHDQQLAFLSSLDADKLVETLKDFQRTE